MDVLSEICCPCGRTIEDGDIAYFRDEQVIGCDYCIERETIYIISEEEARQQAEDDYYDFLIKSEKEDRLVEECYEVLERTL